MGVRLLILDWWTPKYIIRKELQNISQKTTAALKALIPNNATEEVDNENPTQIPHLTVQQQRADMAKTQAKLVEILQETIGNEKVLKQGREALFLVGETIGQQARRKLGVSDNPRDLVKAAKILCRVLGIEFDLEWLDNTNAKVTIKQCALAEHYSDFTCKVLSATDEGAIKGLQPNITMKFTEYMTTGCKTCKANIKINEKELAR